MVYDLLKFHFKISWFTFNITFILIYTAYSLISTHSFFREISYWHSQSVLQRTDWKLLQTFKALYLAMLFCKHTMHLFQWIRYVSRWTFIQEKISVLIINLQCPELLVYKLPVLLPMVRYYALCMATSHINQYSGTKDYPFLHTSLLPTQLSLEYYPTFITHFVIPD